MAWPRGSFLATLESHMNARNKKFERERATIEAMITLFCREQHRSRAALCAECAALATYAGQRLDNCPFHEDKPTCAKCPIHCYKPACREQIKVVMRYAGPRMLFRRPILAIRHKLAERRAAPERPQRKTAKQANLG
jgi:YbgA-like uncharacterized protein